MVYSCSGGPPHEEVTGGRDRRLLRRCPADGLEPRTRAAPGPAQGPRSGLPRRSYPDPYFWLREKGTPRWMKYLEAENAYTEAMKATSKPFSDALYKEMLGRIKQTDLSVPVRRGGFYYYRRTVEGQQYPIRRRKGGAGSRESARGSAARPERAGQGHEVPRPRRVRGERRRPPARLHHRLHRLSPVHAAREGPATGGERRSARASASRAWPGPPTTRRSSTSPRTPSPSAPTRCGASRRAARPLTVYEEKDELFSTSASAPRTSRYLVRRQPLDRHLGARGCSSTATPEGAFRARAAAREGPRVLPGPPRRPVLHPHQQGARRTFAW